MFLEADRAYPRSNTPATNPRSDDEDALSSEKLASDLQRALQLSFEETKASKQPSANNAANEAAQPANEPLVLSASEAFEFLVPTVKFTEEQMLKTTPQILKIDSVFETGTQTDMVLLSTEDKSQQTDLTEDKSQQTDLTEDKSQQTDLTEDNIATEKDIEDSFTSIEKDDKFTSDDDGKEDEKNEVDDEWALVEDETDFVAIGSSMFQQGLNSS